MAVNEAFQVVAMIEKLPPSWRDFKNYLKHQHKEMKLEDHVIRLKIEEDDKTVEKKSRGNSTIMGANIVEETAPKSKKRKRSSGQTKEQNKNKFKGNCYNYGKAGHRAPDCPFATYYTAGPEEELSMGNTTTTKIEVYGKIFLKMTSGKVLTLNNVLHVPTIRKNLVSTSLLIKNGFKCIFVSDKVVVSKNGMYVGKGYLT
ncbi:uncharacterized protein [Nicotiana tomentosiformis]|uniref:uncharacterized protein n=1 Tax=Nicotiana tomentosiformis TaxID=4098 RepID=UPI00388C914A